MNSNTKKKSWWEKVTAPFMVLKIEKFYLFWIVSYLISFAVSFYTYLVTKMQIYDTLLNDFKDNSYTELENEEIPTRNGISKKLKRAKAIIA